MATEARAGNGEWLRSRMLPDDPQAAKEFFRKNFIPRYYSGIFHLFFVSTVGIAVIIFELGRVERLQPWELALAPITFLYANLVEYLAHRWPMHRFYRAIAIIFERHTLQHHAVLTHDAFSVESTRDLKMVLFPSYFIVAMTLAFGLPAAYLAKFVASPNAAHIVGATAMFYFLNYEWLHLFYHLPIAELPGLKVLKQLHRNHHNPALMSRYNFNITYPICDLLFGTYVREGEVPAGASTSASRRRALKLGCFGLLALGGSGLAMSWLRASGTAPGAGFAFLRARDAEVLRALTPVVLGEALPNETGARAQAVSQVLASVDSLLARVARPGQRDFRQLMDLLTFPPTRLLLAELPKPWASATPAELEAALRHWHKSRIGTLNYVYCALIELPHLGWYGSRASWARAGYPGPPQLS